MNLRIESQMRAGTHYILDGLSRAYSAKVLVIRDGKITEMNREEINKGLYEPSTDDTAGAADTIYHNHYYHTIPNDERLASVPVIYLIGYPFDSFYSDGIVFSSKKYSVSPSAQSEKYGTYRLCTGTEEWDFLKPYMQKNAAWVESLIAKDRDLVIRYEDFFLNFEETVAKIERVGGAMPGEFPAPKKNLNRIYWTDNMAGLLEERAFRFLYELFEQGLKHFYPEKYPLNYR